MFFKKSNSSSSAVKTDKVYERARANARLGVWVTKDNTYLNIADMSDSHIRNCINVLIKNNYSFKDLYLPIFEAELKKRALAKA